MQHIFYGDLECRKSRLQHFGTCKTKIIFPCFIIGYPESFREVKGVLKDSFVFLDAEESNLSFKVHCYGSRWDYRQYENFQIMTRLGRYPIIDVTDDVTTWRPGKERFLVF